MKKLNILEIVKVAALVACIYVSYHCYVQYRDAKEREVVYQFNYNKQAISLSNIWSDDQFEPSNPGIKLQFTISQKQNLLKLTNPTLNSSIPLQNLDLQLEDTSQITQCLLLTPSPPTLLLSSRYFTLVYSLSTNLILYQKIHITQSDQSMYVDSQGRLWVVSYPNFNVVLVRVYGGIKRGLLYTGRYAVRERVQFLRVVEEVGAVLRVKLLTFGRNFVVFQFDKNTFQLISQQDFKSHSFSYSLQPFTNLQITLSQKLSQLEHHNLLQNFLHKLTFTHLGKPTPTKPPREPQLDYAFEAIDPNKSLILQTNAEYDSSSVVSFGQVLVPLRTAVFVMREDVGRLMHFDQVLNRSRADQKLPSVDFRLYGIKSKNLEIIRGRTGLYRLLPDSSVHFMTFNKNFLTFYPEENLNQQDYYVVRIPTGGIALKGNQIKGIFEELPVPDPNADQLKFGYSKDEIYQQQTTKGSELAPSIYQAHVIHKGLFVKPYKNRLDLITSLSGKSVLSHYFSKKQNYQYSTSYIQNNEFWVFEHKQNSSPLITKYELFFNASSPKTMLSIKRTYDIEVIGRITRVQKCIDYFYYFHYVTDLGRFGVARIHHVLMSNRQARADQNYAGSFEKMMVIPNIQRNTEFTVSASEQQLLKIEFSIGDDITKNWVELQLKHQYKVLPLRIFAYKNEYYILNIRKLLVNAFDSEMQRIQQDLFGQLLFVVGGFGVLLVLVIGLTYKKRDQDVSKVESPATKPGKKNKKE